MYSLSQLAEAVKNAPNMMDIEAAILTEVFNRHSCTYAKHVQRPGSTEQRNWIQRVNYDFYYIMKYDRDFLFSLIPARFKTTSMYKRLHKLISPVS